MNKPESEKSASRLNHTSEGGIDVDTASPFAPLNDERLPLPETGAAINNLGHRAPTIFRGMWQRLLRRRAECVLAVIIASSALLSLFWVFEVPILQNPDEDSHIDYAFSIYSAGRLLSARRAPSEWNVHARVEGAAFERISHQYTLYLIDSVDFQRLRYHANEKLPPDYGTADYYRRLDLNAPLSPAKVTDLTPQDNPWMVAGYPFGYYALVAVWLKLLSLFSSSPVVLFFGARILSVILLAGSLVLTYVTLRELRLSKVGVLTLTAAVGFFPLTTFVSSAVQPDNLALFLVLLCFYCGLRLRREGGDSLWLLGFLGVALGALVITKYHFFLFTVLSLLGMLVSEHIFQRQAGMALLRKLTILLLPSVLLFGVQLWVYWGGGIANNFKPATLTLVAGAKKAVLDYYRGGPAFVSWWGTYGWMDAPLIIRSPLVQWRVLILLSVLTPVVLVLTLFRLEQVLTRLVVFAGRGRWRMALRIVFSNPLVNSHFIFTVFMILLYAVTDNTFFAQGRNWFPYIVSSFLITTQYAPRALTHRKTQAAVSTLLILGLAFYCAIGSYYSIKTIRERFYATQPNSGETAG